LLKKKKKKKKKFKKVGSNTKQAVVLKDTSL